MTGRSPDALGAKRLYEAHRDVVWDGMVQQLRGLKSLDHMMAQLF